MIQIDNIQLNTITELCFDTSSKFSFIQSEKKLINFDMLAKKLGAVVSSPDALIEEDSTIYFIEFKNQKSSKISPKNLLEKLYGGITIYSHFSYENYFQKDDIKIKYIIIGNQEKDQEYESNPLKTTMNEILTKSGNQITLDEVKKKCNQGMLKRLGHLILVAKALSKYNISIEISCLLFKDERENFISSLTTL